MTFSRRDVLTQLAALSVSIVGLPGDDVRVLAFAHAYERQSRRFAAPGKV